MTFCKAIVYVQGIPCLVGPLQEAESVPTFPYEVGVRAAIALQMDADEVTEVLSHRVRAVIKRPDDSIALDVEGYQVSREAEGRVEPGDEALGLLEADIGWVADQAGVYTVTVTVDDQATIASRYRVSGP
jgi:hypothetical protein